MITFVMMMGIEGSDKSKFARKEFVAKRGYMLVSSDEIAKEFETDPQKRALLEQAVNEEYVEGANYVHPLISGLPSREALRQEILSELNLKEILRRIRDNLQTGKNVVWDATNLNRFNRIERIKLVREWGAQRVVCCWMNLPVWRCAANLTSKSLPQNRDTSKIVVDERAYKFLSQRVSMLEPPIDEEGFDEIMEIKEEVQGD